jgi:hypothetical protein
MNQRCKRQDLIPHDRASPKTSHLGRAVRWLSGGRKA